MQHFNYMFVFFNIFNLLKCKILTYARTHLYFLKCYKQSNKTSAWTSGFTFLISTPVYDIKIIPFFMKIGFIQDFYLVKS